MSLVSHPNDRAEPYSDEIDLIDILRFVFQEKKKLISFGLLGAILGFAIMALLPGQALLVSSVKVDLEKSLNQVPFDSLKTALGSATSDPRVVEAGIQIALDNDPEFKKSLSEKGLSMSDLAAQVSQEKLGHRIIEIEPGSNPNAYTLKVNLPRQISFVEQDKVAILILNGIVQAYNEDNRRQQLAQERMRATVDPSPYTLALDNFTTISGKLADIETTLIEMVPEWIVKHVQSSGFAPSATVLEAQFARVRFLIGIAETRGKMKAEQLKKLRSSFLELQDNLGAAQLELDVASEAKRELFKKNLPLIQKDPLPLFQSSAPAGKSVVKAQQSSKKQLIAAIAGGLMGVFACFFLIIVSRFFRQNWTKITAS